jgi:hypothetical protein
MGQAILQAAGGNSFGADGLPLELEVAAYYSAPAVRARIAEYCGGTPECPQAFRACGLGGYGGAGRLHLPEGAPFPVGPAEFEKLLEEGADICRSLADRDGTLLQLDIDYVDPDNPADVHFDPEACFARMEPVYRAARRVFQSYGVPTVDLVTARGYHLTVRVPAGTRLHAAMVNIGRVGAPLRAKYAAGGGDAEVLRGQAHDGAGRLLEHLAHRVIRRLRGKTEIPVVVADVPRAAGGAFVCLDLSAYGDPLGERFIRCAFATNQKAREITPSRPVTINLRRRGHTLAALLRARESPSQAARWAADESAVIPDAPGNQLRWIRDYRRGPLAQFHQTFDAGWHDEPEDWPHTYDCLDLASLPACVRFPLERPNPALLQPLWVRTVALALWGTGWHPRSVAGLIRSKYERDFGWGKMWYRYDAAARADFYVRLFCGALACGIDPASDLTCAAQAARGACPAPDCGHDLGAYLSAITPAPETPVG